MIVEWKHDWLPNLMGSEIGKWMLENNLTEYYSEQMNKDLQEAATSKGAGKHGFGRPRVCLIMVSG